MDLGMAAVEHSETYVEEWPELSDSALVRRRQRHSLRPLSVVVGRQELDRARFEIDPLALAKRYFVPVGHRKPCLSYARLDVSVYPEENLGIKLT